MSSITTTCSAASSASSSGTGVALNLLLLTCTHPSYASDVAAAVARSCVATAGVDTET